MPSLSGVWVPKKYGMARTVVSVWLCIFFVLMRASSKLIPYAGSFLYNRTMGSIGVIIVLFSAVPKLLGEEASTFTITRVVFHHLAINGPFIRQRVG